MAGNSRRFRFCDLAVVAAIIPVMFIVAVTCAQRAGETDKRVECAQNLRKLGLAMIMYANQETRNGQSFPRTYWDSDSKDLHFFTGADQPNSFGKSGPKSNDVTAAFYLILKTQEVDPAWLHCPSSNSKIMAFGNKPGALAKSMNDHSNFPGIAYLSYSIQVMYPSSTAVQSGYRWNVTLDAEYPLLADLNPGEAATKVLPPLEALPPDAVMQSPGNSPNHNHDGQNVLYADCHVMWTSTPYAGQTKGQGNNTWNDNIYTARTGALEKSGGAIYAMPYDAEDSIMLPAAGYKEAPTAK